MQFWAKIKRSSKYFNQNEWAKNYPEQFGLPFPVTILPDHILSEAKVADDYCVQGGPGGQYCLRDVQLFIKRSDGKLVRFT